MKHVLGYLVDAWIVGMLAWSVTVMWRDEQRRRDDARRLPRINTRPPASSAPRFTRDNDPSPRARRRAS